MKKTGKIHTSIIFLLVIVGVSFLVFSFFYLTDPSITGAVSGVDSIKKMI